MGDCVKLRLPAFIKIIHYHVTLTVYHSLNVAGQRCECRGPLTIFARLPCSEVDSQRAELRGARGLWGVRVDVSTPGDLEFDKACGNYRCLELCIQQSAGDSALP
jgi:hypothetical protein